MLDKTAVPTIDELSAYCGKTAELFEQLNDCLSETYSTAKKDSFPLWE